MFDKGGRYTCGDCQQHNLLGAGSIGGAIRDVNRYIHHHAKNRYGGAAAHQQVDRGLSVSSSAPQVPSMVLQKQLTKVETYQQALKQLNDQVGKMKVHIKELQNEEEMQSKADQIMMKQAAEQATLTKNFEYQQNLLQKSMSKQMEAVQSRTLSNVPPPNVTDQADLFAQSLANIATSISPRSGPSDLLPRDGMYFEPNSNMHPLHSIQRSIQNEQNRVQNNHLVEEARRTTQAGIRTDPPVGAPTFNAGSQYDINREYDFTGPNFRARSQPTVLATQSRQMGSQLGNPDRLVDATAQGQSVSNPRQVYQDYKNASAIAAGKPSGSVVGGNSHTSVYGTPQGQSVSGFNGPYNHTDFYTHGAIAAGKTPGLVAAGNPQSHFFDMTNPQ